MDHFGQHHKDNKDDFNFSNMNFPLLDINILTAIAMYSIGKQGNTYAWPLICLCTDFNESGKVKLGEHTVAGRDCYIL
jgi:hypothetical protein